MAVRINPSSSTLIPKSADHRIATRDPQTNAALIHKVPELGKRRHWKFTVRCSEKQAQSSLRTCKICKAKFDPLLNHSRACRYHPAHFGGETKRKFESVYSGGTMNTPDSGKISKYWHCCGSEDIFHPGCTPTPHASYDD